MIIHPEKPEQLVRLLKSAPVVLYGMGGAGLRIAQWCDENQISYIFADKNAECRQKETGKTVIQPQRLAEQYPDANIVISSIIYFSEIRQDLLQLGIREDRILSYKLFMPDHILWSALDDNIDWDLMRFRVEMFSRWIPEDVRSVVDYGAGKMYLWEYLGREIEYFPVDYIRRNEQTILCDLNQGVFPEIQADVAVCSGVLEFIDTAEALLVHVCTYTKRMVILSYLGIDNFPDIEGRRASAYVSDLSEKQILDLMASNGFRLGRKVPDPVNHACVVYAFWNEAHNG